MKPRLRRHRFVLLGLVGCLGLGVGALAVRSADGGDAIPTAARSRGYERLVPSLCAMREAVQRSEAERARALFWNNAHEILHVLAADLTERGDRSASAQLLRAKAGLELTVAGPAAELSERPDAAIDHIEALVNASTTALRSVVSGPVVSGPVVLGPLDSCADPEGAPRA